MNIHDVHFEAFDFLTSRCIDPIHRLIKQRSQTRAITKAPKMLPLLLPHQLLLTGISHSAEGRRL